MRKLINGAYVNVDAPENVPDAEIDIEVWHDQEDHDERGFAEGHAPAPAPRRRRGLLSAAMLLFRGNE